MSMFLQKYKVFLNNTNLRIDISHKHFHAIYFKHAHISQLPDFVATQQFHSSRAFVEIIAERNAAVPALDFTRARPWFEIYGVRGLEHTFDVVMWIAWGISRKCCCKLG